VPDVVLPMAALTEKDRSDLAFAVEQGVDWIALSFVQRPEDLAEARKLIGGKAALLAKIEKPAAIERLEEIVEQCDGVMVARGDLGVELPPQTVPPLQKRIVETARRMGRPVVVATQMLESMIEVARRRRAPKCPTSRPRSMTAPTRSCSRPRARRAPGRSNRWR
jgi:pyruvate kinase